MLIQEFCLKLYLWPFLSHLANKNGICKYITPFPYITLAPGATLASTTPTTTVITTTTTRTTTTTTTTTTCSPFPPVCLPGGVSPQPNCPCIDPRFSMRFASAFKGRECQSIDLRQSDCVPIKSCPYIVEEYYYQTQTVLKGVNFDQFLNNSLCNWDVNNLMICCPNVNSGNWDVIYTNKMGGLPPYFVGNPQNQNFEAFTEVFTFAPIQNENHFSIITSTEVVASNDHNSYVPKNTPEDCGSSDFEQFRVLEGFETRRGAYPWMVALGHSNFDAKIFLCAGTLVTTEKIITSAHCVTNKLNFARLGTNNFKSPEESSIDVTIVEKIIHEHFDANTITNDIAILKIGRAVPKSNLIKPICLPFDTDLRNKNLVGMNVFIAGWGAVEYGEMTSSTLHHAHIEIVDLNECKKNYSKIFPSNGIDQNVICAGTGITDACKGDSGGPLMLPLLSLDKTKYQYFLMGIVSFGYECGKPGFPGIYTRVSSYMPWIEKHL